MYSFGCEVESVGCKVQGVGCRVLGLGYSGLLGLGFIVSGLGFRV